jgi:hypothetical protein
MAAQGTAKTPNTAGIISSGRFRKFMSIEALKSFFDVGAVVLLFLAFAFGAGVLITGNVINDRQAERLRQFDKQLTDAKTKLGEQEVLAADAQKNLAGIQKDAADAKAAQQRVETDLAKAKERAAGLEIEALKFRRELLRQGPRANLIAGENRRKLVDALKPFTNQKVDVRHSASIFMINGRVMQTTPLGDDVLSLANALVGVLKEAGWSMPPKLLPARFMGQGITVEIVHESSRGTKAAAQALVAALNDVPLTVTGPSEIPDDAAKRAGEDIIQPAFDENTIVLNVLTHP